MRKSRAIPFISKTKFVIIVDGDCEYWYFKMLKRNEKTLAADLKPEIPQKKKLKKQFEKVIEESNHYDKVFWIVDYDVIHNESRASKNGAETPKQAFKKYVSQLAKKYKYVVIIINNPCLEFWILLHFETTGKYFDNCEDATKQLKKHLPDYEKTSKYYTKQDNDIYLRLKPKLNDAIANANKLKMFDLDNPDTAITQMHLLFETEELKPIIDSR